MADENNSLIGLIKEVSEMKGVLSQVVTQLIAQQQSNALAIEAVKATSDSTATTTAAHSVEIANIKTDIVTINSEKQSALGKVMMVVSPLLAGLAIFMAMAKDIYIK